MASERYFVDKRVGCVAVRDRELTNPDYPGLHADTPGVIAFYMGVWRGDEWGLRSSSVTACEKLVDLLNGYAEMETTLALAKTLPAYDAPIPDYNPFADDEALPTKPPTEEDAK